MREGLPGREVRSASHVDGITQVVMGEAFPVEETIRAEPRGAMRGACVGDM